MLHQTSIRNILAASRGLWPVLDIALTNFNFEDANMSEFKKLRTSRNHNSDNQSIKANN